MPIIGKVNATPPECSLMYMPVGSKGYISFYQVIITRKAIFIDIKSPVVLVVDEDDDEDDDTMKDFLPIRRIGAGLTPNDFEVDFTDSDDFDMLLDSVGTYYDLIKEPDRYVIFTEYLIGENEIHDDIHQNENDELTDLKERLKIAIEKQKFKTAAKIRDRIKELEDKDKKSN